MPLHFEWSETTISRFEQYDVKTFIQLEDYRKPDGSFHFKVCYPHLLLPNPCVHWEQTTNPAVNETIHGFRLLRDGGLDPSPDSSVCPGKFNGLKKSENDWVALESGSCWGIGVTTPNSLRGSSLLKGPGLGPPAYDHFTRSVELWVELASNDNEPVSVDEHGNVEHFKEIKLELPVCHSGISDDASENVFTAEVIFFFL